MWILHMRSYISSFLFEHNEMRTSVCLVGNDVWESANEKIKKKNSLLFSEKNKTEHSLYGFYVSYVWPKIKGRITGKNVGYRWSCMFEYFPLCTLQLFFLPFHCHILFSLHIWYLLFVHGNAFLFISTSINVAVDRR